MSAQSNPWDGSPVIPLVVIEQTRDVNSVMDALLAGGISTIEIAIRTPVAIEAIKVAAARGDFRVAAGTVTDESLVSAAIDAGADFGLSPASQDSVIDAVIRENWPFLPAIATPSEAARMLDRGFDHLKVFPADLIGGERFLKAIGSVMPSLRLLPSGGVSEANMASLLAQPNVFGVSGSWIAPKEIIAARDFAEITARAIRAIEIANGHV